MPKKIYAVRNGRQTGLFTTWAECQKQVTGYAGARFKGFTSAEEAMRWLSGDDCADSHTAQSSGHRLFHGEKVPRLHQEQPADTDQDYIIYTDGSCLRNPDGPGGWAMVARTIATGAVSEQSGGHSSTTNNRMELTAAIKALQWAPAGSRVALYTDSQYLKNGITRWLAAWKRRGWKKADGTPVLNRELWMALDALYGSHHVTFHWVKGHAGVDLNERCDQLAKKEAMKY